MSSSNAVPVFVVSPYSAGPDGVLKPAMPTVCPRGAGGGRTPCTVKLHHSRERSTGPGFALVVLHCETHGKAFTVYPPGHVPYGRQPVAKVAPDGSAVAGAGGGAAPYADTLLSAATDAAEGIAWRRECAGDMDQRRWSTQCRRIALSTRVLGVSPELPEQIRGAIAEALAVPGLLLHAAANDIKTDSGYRQQGRSVSSVLEAMEPPARAYYRIAEAGHLAQCWGRPLCWQPQLGHLVPTPYRVLNPRSPP